MRISKINTIGYGGKWIAAGVLTGIVIPVILWLFFGHIIWPLVIIGAFILTAFLIVFIIEMRQDFGKNRYDRKHLKDEFCFDPDKQFAVIRSSICTGEKVAGFKDKETGHFTEVMLIRSPEDEAAFMTAFHPDTVKTEY